MEGADLLSGGAFVYDSFVTLEATPGRMGGHYLLRDAWGGLARARVPDFALSVPGRDERVLN